MGAIAAMSGELWLGRVICWVVRSICEELPHVFTFTDHDVNPSAWGAGNGPIGNFLHMHGHVNVCQDATLFGWRVVLVRTFIRP
jgi:hypothetical protein